MAGFQIFSSGFLTGHIRRPTEWLLHRFVNLTYRHAEHIAVISPGMIDLLASRGVRRSKLSLVYNWVEDLPGAVGDRTGCRERLGLTDDDFLLMYAGNHGGAQSLSAVIEAVGQLSSAERCHLVMIGDGVEKAALEQLAVRVAAERVHFVPPQPRDSMWALMREADVSWLHSPTVPSFR